MRDTVHELNNVLLVIQATAATLQRRFPEGTRERQDVDQILRAVERAGEIVRRLPRG